MEIFPLINTNVLSIEHLESGSNDLFLNSVRCMGVFSDLIDLCDSVQAGEN